MNKVIVGSLITTVIAVGGIIFLFQNNTPATTSAQTGSSNVTTINGKQVIEIKAKGGYNPQKMIAKANTPTTLNITTDGTFDCSSALNIPSIGFRKSLPPSGTTPIELPPQPQGSTLTGVCAMGMYHFAVNFN